MKITTKLLAMALLVGMAEVQSAAGDNRPLIDRLIVIGQLWKDEPFRGAIEDLGFAALALDLPAGSSEADVRNSFRRKSLLVHPDRNADNKEKANDAFKTLNNANSTFKDGFDNRYGPGMYQSAQRFADRQRVIVDDLLRTGADPGAARRQEEMRRRAEEARRADEARRRAEEARRADEAKRAEEARRADQARADAARRAEEARRADEARRRAEETRKAEQARAEAARRAEEVRRAEQVRADAARRAEEARRADEARRRAEVEAQRAAQRASSVPSDADKTYAARLAEVLRAQRAAKSAAGSTTRPAASPAASSDRADYQRRLAEVLRRQKK